MRLRSVGYKALDYKCDGLEIPSEGDRKFCERNKIRSVGRKIRKGGEWMREASGNGRKIKKNKKSII